MTILRLAESFKTMNRPDPTRCIFTRIIVSYFYIYQIALFFKCVNFTKIINYLFEPDNLSICAEKNV